MVLAASNNDIEKARYFLTENASKSFNDDEQSESSLIYGLYCNVAEDIQLNLQTAEVYFSNRMLMPVPQEVSANSDFHSIFAQAPLYCAVDQTKQYRKSYHIQHDQYTYHIHACALVPYLLSAKRKSLLPNYLPKKTMIIFSSFSNFSFHSL